MLNLARNTHILAFPRFVGKNATKPLAHKAFQLIEFLGACFTVQLQNVTVTGQQGHNSRPEVVIIPGQKGAIPL